ncbi:MAG: pimeloyl-CoA dehydrogenase large subunit [Alphaproteobacteria bacterium]|nr:MAG: pimeloyl-CoA dehydrogenase large subunit [Alphaproteobacteria bacterium]
MDLAFSPEDEAFRQEVREFIAAEWTDDLAERQKRSKTHHLGKEATIAWQQKLAKKGWMGINWPKEYGGPGFTQVQKYIFDFELNAAGVPLGENMGTIMCAPVIMAFGTDEQKKEHLPKTRAGERWWCQGYSEPGSGSDLASLSLKAEDKGDHYLLNGSKTWTTFAQYADWMFLLARTDNSGKKQEGISFLLLDMKTPGITIDPIYTIDLPAIGHQEVNQCFFEDVKVPKENLVGKENDGWTCAKYLLQFERGNAYAPRLTRVIEHIKEMAKKERSDTGTRLIDDEDFARQIADCERELMAIDFNERRVFAALSTGGAVGANSSMLKLRGTEVGQRLELLATEAVGYYVMPFERDTDASLDGLTNQPPIGPDYAASLAPIYFNHRKTTIYAGSSEVQRNIMSKAILGL